MSEGNTDNPTGGHQIIARLDDDKNRRWDEELGKRIGEKAAKEKTGAIERSQIAVDSAAIRIGAAIGAFVEAGKKHHSVVISRVEPAYKGDVGTERIRVLLPRSLPDGSRVIAEVVRSWKPVSKLNKLVKREKEHIPEMFQANVVVIEPKAVDNRLKNNDLKKWTGSSGDPNFRSFGYRNANEFSRRWSISFGQYTNELHPNAQDFTSDYKQFPFKVSEADETAAIADKRTCFDLPTGDMEIDVYGNGVNKGTQRFHYVWDGDRVKLPNQPYEEGFSYEAEVKSEVQNMEKALELGGF